MSIETDDRANIPADPLQEFTDNLAEETRDLAEQLADQAVGANKVPKEITPEKEPLVIDFIRQSELLLRRADKTRRDKKKPHDDRGKIVQARFRDMMGVLQTALAPVQDRHHHYKQAREAEERRRRDEEARQRREAEEAARREAEAKQREAERKAREASDATQRRQAAADLQRAQEAQARADEAAAQRRESEKARTGSYAVEGDLGTKAFSVGRWTVQGVNMESVDLEALRPHLKPEHVEQAARAWVKAQGNQIEARAGSLKGVRIEQVSKTQYR